MITNNCQASSGGEESDSYYSGSEGDDMEGIQPEPESSGHYSAIYSNTPSFNVRFSTKRLAIVRQQAKSLYKF